ncbi:hypothetical protein HZY97_04210 [Sphingomonas sp. R-74633]|uniref:hypothetical protein n=1 Tax=Sphingomonas sp. R-74633 TaxID=2751188 RepID=UPI0015D27810|nr:hypothetical protein [Sphingomonas sp. R-74633]NYT39948.1 hypothetical protein [Sphingomonas sp. R-74633]
MSASLVRQQSGYYSLELETADLDALKSAILDRYGTPKTKRYPMLTVYRFGGCSFTFQHQWDDPCLIASSAEGDAILETLHGVLSGAD